MNLSSKGGVMKNKVKSIVIYSTIIILIILDQISKYVIEINKEILPINIIDNALNISYCQNIGVAFGFGEGNLIIFIIANILILGIIAKFIIIPKNKIDNINRLILGIIFAGGTSNLIDRIIRGYVVDFIDVNELIQFPVFNFADILICFGAVSLGISLIKYINVKK